MVLVYAPSVAWLRSYPVSLSGACRLTLVGLLCRWVPRSCGVSGLHKGVTCLRSGLCSFSVRDRNEDLPSFWRVWLPAFVWGSHISGRGCVLQPAVVPEAFPPPGGFGYAPSRWVPLLRD